MKVFNIKEVDDKYKVNLGDGLVLKPFYTWEEKAEIFDTMKAQSSAVLRDMALMVKTAEFCTNVDFVGMNDAEKYDIVAELRLNENFEVEVSGYLDMHKLVDREESTYKALSQIIEVISNKMDSFDIAKIQEGFSGLGGVIKDANSK